MGGGNKETVEKESALGSNTVSLALVTELQAVREGETSLVLLSRSLACCMWSS